ncbi:hypothetical protein CEP53_011969 [Fusarium sp. AF-6]|nr:hypothetical protein CEP53_011969 [Fusarium sp. AF-6]
MATSEPLTTTISTQLQTQSGFFIILNEDIRNQICEYLFGRTTVNIEFWPQEHHYYISLLGTCQRAYMEGMRILYSTNVFKFSRDVGLDMWVGNIKALRWDLVRKVDLRIPFAVDLWQWEKTWEILCAMPHLRSAKLHCEDKIHQFVDLPSGGVLLREIKDPFKKAGFFLPWAVNPMLRPRMSDEVAFEITFNIERRKTLEVLIKALRDREIRGIRIGWVTKWTGVVGPTLFTVYKEEEIGDPDLSEQEDPIEWEDV